MFCPYCGADDTKVIDSRLVTQGQTVKRRRACTVCEERFNTFEEAELVMPKVTKRDGRVDAFDEEKLRGGLIRAFKKRPLKSEQFEALIEQIIFKVRNQGGREVTSLLIGEMVMEALRQVDAVAYIRFASVYDAFSDIKAFKQLIHELELDQQVPVLPAIIDADTVPEVTT